MKTKFLRSVVVVVMRMRTYVNHAAHRWFFSFFPFRLANVFRIKCLICISQYQPRINTRQFEITKSTFNPLF